MDIKELIEGTMEDYWGRFDRALEGLTREELAWRPQAACNSIGFIAWHMARVEDRFVHHFAQGVNDVWVKHDWYTQFGLEATDHGVRFTLEQVAVFPAIAPEQWYTSTRRIIRTNINAGPAQHPYSCPVQHEYGCCVYPMVKRFGLKKHPNSAPLRESADNQS